MPWTERYIFLYEVQVSQGFVKMPELPPSFPLRPTRPMSWRPMTDAEWAELSQVLNPKGRGRPARDARRIWDGIFWVACSRGPWREMPACFGKPDTAHRTLRRAAQGQALHGMLVRVSAHPLVRGSALHGIAWFVVRAFRRAFRVVRGAFALPLRLGLASALPCAPTFLPRPDLSENLSAFARQLLSRLGPRTAEAIRLLHYFTGRCLGDARQWRTTD